MVCESHYATYTKPNYEQCHLDILGSVFLIKAPQSSLEGWLDTFLHKNKFPKRFYLIFLPLLQILFSCSLCLFLPTRISFLVTIHIVLIQAKSVIKREGHDWVFPKKMKKHARIDEATKVRKLKWPINIRNDHMFSYVVVVGWKFHVPWY